jgi:predicted DCC family thiol-disulfide oxidoreductase YuxK
MTANASAASAPRCKFAPFYPGQAQPEAVVCSVLFFSRVLPVAGPLEMLFYDGYCGLCHRSVKFVMRHDPSGELFHFAPLQGDSFAGKVPSERRAGLPDSVVVLTADGRLLVRSDATLHILRRLGGGWRTLAGISAIVPRFLRDGVYNLIARVRYSIFGRKDDLCPLVPAELRNRFEP